MGKGKTVMKTKPTQKEQVLNYLKDGYSLTPLVALNKFGSLRLSGVIFKLKKQGWPIETKLVKTKTNKQVAMYTLKGQTPLCRECYYFIGNHEGSCKFQDSKFRATDIACSKFRKR